MKEALLYIFKRMLFYCRVMFYAFVILLVYIYFFRLYHGSVERPRIYPKAEKPAETVVAAARSLKGILYDQTKGKYNNIGGRCGMLVCIDVPRIAYAKAGIDMDSMLRADYKIHKQFYWHDGAPNTPESGFFVRRVRNLLAYCRANGKLIMDAPEPRPGDLVIYGMMHVAMVSDTDGKGNVRIIETAPDTLRTVEHDWTPWEPQKICRLLD